MALLAGALAASGSAEAQTRQAPFVASYYAARRRIEEGDPTGYRDVATWCETFIQLYPNRPEILGPQTQQILGPPEIAMSRANYIAGEAHMKIHERDASMYCWRAMEQARPHRSRFPDHWIEVCLLAAREAVQSSYVRYNHGSVWGHRAAACIEIAFAEATTLPSTATTLWAARVLAETYLNRISGVREHDLDRAIEIATRFGELAPSGATALQAELLACRARALAQKGRRERSDAPLNAAWNDGRRAVGLLRRDDQPDVIAAVQLALAEAALESGRPRDAIAPSRTAVAAVRRLEADVRPDLYVRGRLLLARALLSSGSRRDRAEAAVLLEAAIAQQSVSFLTITGPQTAPWTPLETLDAAALLGDVQAGDGQWQAALQRYGTARGLLRSRTLFGRTMTFGRAVSMAERSQRVSRNAAYALMKRGELQRAAFRLDEGRASLTLTATGLHDLLRQPDVTYETGEVSRREDRLRVATNFLTLADYERRLLEPQANIAAIELGLVGQSEVVANGPIYNETAFEGEIIGPDVGQNAPDVVQPLDAQRRAFLESNAVVSVLASSFGSGVLSFGPQGARFDDASDDDTQSTAEPVWRSPALQAPLSKALAAAIASSARPNQPVIVSPDPQRARLPISLLRHPETDRELIEDYDVVVAPSLFNMARAVASARDRGAFPSRVASLRTPAGAGDLRFAELEVALVRSSFASGSVRASAASPDALLTHLASADCWHIASHAEYVEADPLSSWIAIAPGVTISLRQLMFNTTSVGAPPRLVFLSACQTAVADRALAPEEYLGLASGFMALGAVGVVGSLWSVPDISTSLLVSKFYELYKEAPGQPWRALRMAQLWLRRGTADDFQVHLEKYAHRSGVSSAGLEAAAGAILEAQGSMPFADPYHWAAWVYYGA